MKKTTKILAIILCVSLMLTMLVGCGGIDGTYYYLVDGEKNKNNWIKIEDGEWEDCNGLYGVVFEDGNSVTLSIDIFGSYIDIVTGTIDGNTFTCEVLGDEMVYEK